jgi:hypothetical protein
VTNTNLEFELKARVAPRERHVCAVGRGGRGHGVRGECVLAVLEQAALSDVARAR